MSDDISFSNMDSWKGGSSGKYGLSFKQIILFHINRCVINGSCEFHGGYWNEVGTNPPTRTYVQNSRDVYSNSVKILRALLLPYFDKDVKAADINLQEEYNAELKKFNEKDLKDKESKYELMDYKVMWHLKLFEALIQLGKRLNFFEEESFEGEAI